MIHVAVHAADHQIQLAQRVVFQIHGAVAADVALDPGEHAQPEPALIHFAHLVRERDGALLVQTVGHRQSFRMIGDRDVFVTHRPRRFGHFLERGPAVALARVHVQIAANMLQLHQLRKGVRLGGFDFALILAQLRRNPVEAQRPVDLLFGLAGHGLLGIDVRQRVLVQRESHLLRPARSATLCSLLPVKYCSAAP